MSYYAVAKGFTPGIYITWAQCYKETSGFKGALFKKFASLAEARTFVRENRPSLSEKTDTKEKSSDGSEVTLEIGDDIGSTIQEMKKDIEDMKKNIRAMKKRKHPDDEEKDTKKLHTDKKSKFFLDEHGSVVIYISGHTCYNDENEPQAGIGVFFSSGHPLNVSAPVKGQATNSRAEIQAATRAVELARASGFKKVTIRTVSQFIVHCIPKQLRGWKVENWEKSVGLPIKNKAELIALKKACEGIIVQWIDVEDFDYHGYIAEADRLARAGAILHKPE